MSVKFSLVHGEEMKEEMATLVVEVASSRAVFDDDGWVRLCSS